VITGSFYTCEVDPATGSITSYRDLRRKNLPREIVRTNNRLNQLTIHEDVPFFWDNWDIMHHSFETSTSLKPHDRTDYEVCDDGQTISITFKYKY